MDPKTVEELVAREAIREQLHAYCRAVDRIDPELGYRVWHGAGTADYGELFQGSGREFVDWVCAAHRRLLNHSHQITTTGITVVGRRAVSEAYVTAALRWRKDDTTWESLVRGRYVDTWSFRDGRWAIEHREYLHDFEETRPVVQERMTGRGRRDDGDPSYAAFARLPHPAPAERTTDGAVPSE